jgi:hypothetical protein
LVLAVAGQSVEKYPFLSLSLYSFGHYYFPAGWKMTTFIEKRRAGGLGVVWFSF